MKKLFAIVAIIFTLSHGAYAADKKIRVLFIGENVAMLQQVQATLTDMAGSRRHQFYCEVYGGGKLSDYVTDPKALAAIKKKKWNYVVLQEQSQALAVPQEQVASEVYPSAEKLCHLIREADRKIHVVFFQNMAWKDGDPDNAAVSPDLVSYKGMQEQFNLSGQIMAQKNRALLAPVGAAFEQARDEYTDIYLYDDETDLSAAGTCLTACVFYSVFFRESPAGASYPDSVDESTAFTLQAIGGGILKTEEWNFEKR